MRDPESVRNSDRGIPTRDAPRAIKNGARTRFSARFLLCLQHKVAMHEFSVTVKGPDGTIIFQRYAVVDVGQEDPDSTILASAIRVVRTALAAREANRLDPDCGEFDG